MVKKIWNVLRSLGDWCWNWFQLKYHHVKYEPGFLNIHGRLFIFGGNIRIGKHVAVNSGMRYNPIGGDVSTILRTHQNGSIAIGDYTGISNSCIVSYDSVTIGSHVLIGGSCKIYDTDFHSLKAEIRRDSPQEDIKSKPVVIEDDVFVGAHTIILKGVTIGKGSIVGAGSVVTRSIPPGEVWGGNPAKFIREL
ncbi:MAG: acyltransferase [Lachnospiraceae bacterium]|nr:acyltransferase [Lachnospiraceae bacterium]